MSAPAVAVHADGTRTAIAWMDERLGKGERRVYWSVSAAGERAEEAPVDPASARSQDHPAVVFDAAGMAWIAWEEGRRTEQRIRVRSSRKDFPPVQASDQAHGKAAFPSLAAGGGMVGLVHEAGEKGREAVVFRRVE
jgi:hypothetical protein